MVEKKIEWFGMVVKEFTSFRCENNIYYHLISFNAIYYHFGGSLIYYLKKLCNATVTVDRYIATLIING